LENPIGLHLKFYQDAPGEVYADYTAPESYQGYPGVVHGGIVAAMLDEVAGRTLIGSEPPRFMFTARLVLRYCKNVPVGKSLRLVGQAIKVKEKTAVGCAQIFGPGGDLLAEAEALLVDIPSESFSNVDLESLGWKVYPDDPESSHPTHHV
jgi:acyl-coenzyme A thioesterase PaaI-like protein